MRKVNLFFFGEEHIHLSDALWFYVLPSTWLIVALLIQLL